ncbi:nucleoside 2-deoxyribosyltransferase [Salmonella enterica subsp. enterica serovar Oranienburg]|nr:nucleoside 2-deoxyribosyltransferase [Salmonella enterica subsp. enterica serovar Oranienburg]
MAIIYIAGPMTGLENFNRDNFNITAVVLKSMGHTVLNPALLPDGLTYGQYMKIGKAMLECADTIYLLEGWQDSPGATAEYDLAKRLGLEVSTPESRKGGASC